MTESLASNHDDKMNIPLNLRTCTSPKIRKIRVKYDLEEEVDQQYSSMSAKRIRDNGKSFMLRYQVSSRLTSKRTIYDRGHQEKTCKGCDSFDLSRAMISSFPYKQKASYTNSYQPFLSVLHFTGVCC